MSLDNKNTVVNTSEEYEKTPKQIADEKIREIKRKAKDEIAEIKKNLIIETMSVNKAAIDKACKRENRRRYRAAKREEYINRKNRYSFGEEIFNSITHGIGTGLSIAATVLLVVHACFAAPEQIRGFYITSFAIFGASLIFVYLMSTLYHALTPIGAKKVFAIFDHASIYILIAGTYTPFCLAILHNALGWTLFGIIWGLTALGVVLYSVFGSRMRIISAITYIIMGWMIIVAIKPLISALPTVSIVFLIAGGIVYTIGFAFYAAKNIKWMHPIWHIFAVSASVLHFFALYLSI